jgi:glycosyltransferase involved in cell wall biosynthesis
VQLSDGMNTSANSPPHEARDQRIVACVPYYDCRRYIRRAVLSLLQQTCRNLTVVVVNDGDPQPPWDELADIRDPRLVGFDLARNLGPYFASAVVLNASSAPYFLVQDADDWSAPARAATLLGRLQADASDFAVSAQPQYIEGGKRATGVRWATISRSAVPQQRFTVNCVLGPQYAYRAPHHGLFRSDAIRRVGGYYGGFRVGYDTLLTNLILMTGRLSYVAQPLYYRQVRPGSLSHSPQTGHGSAFAGATQKEIVSLYRKCFEHYAGYLRGDIDGERLSRAIRDCVMAHVTLEDRQQLALETQRLKQRLAESGAEPGPRNFDKSSVGNPVQLSAMS